MKDTKEDSMRSKVQRDAGRHRKIVTSQTTKGRIAVLTVAAGAVSTAGVGGATAANVESDNIASTTTKTQSVDYKLAADTSEVNNAPARSSDAAPQVLNVAVAKPVTNLVDQLSKSIQASTDRAAEDLAARAPSVVSPALGTFTSGFGPRWGSFHSGVDIANAIGTPIFSVMDGIVIDSGPASGYGQWIRILHDDGTMTLYGHMQTLDVSVGERVLAGQKIAGMGSMGFSTGSHLHFEVHPNSGDAVDPQAWLAERGIQL